MLALEAFENPEVRRKLSVADWQHWCAEGAVEMLEQPDTTTLEEDRDLKSIAFAALPISMQKAVTRIRWYSEAVLNPQDFYDRMMPDVPQDRRHLPDKLSARKVDPLLLDVKMAYKDDKKPGFSTVRGWVREYQVKRDWVLLAPRYDRRGSDDATAIVGPVKRIVNKAILDAWLKPGGTKVAVWDLVNPGVAKLKRRHPDRRIGVSERQVYRYIDANVDNYETAVAQRGKEWADRNRKPVMAGPGANYALQIVDVDHTQAKLEVTHDETGENMGRPWITVALDRRTRMVVGLHVHFEGETVNAALQCLKNVLMPKRFLRQLEPGITYDYPCCGTPVMFHFDRSTGFDNDHIDEVGTGLDINISYSPGNHPEYKGGIERFMASLHRRVALGVKGATPRVNGTNGNQRPRKSEATMSFSDFCARIWFWVAMVYAKQFHDGLKDVPLDAWNESVSAKPLRPPPLKEKVELYLLRAVRVQLTRTGVEVSGLIWNERRVVQRILSYPGPRPIVLVRIDDNDLGRAFITDPITRLIEPLEPVLESYMRGTTWFQHELVKRKLDKKRNGTHSERALIEAKAKLVREAVETFGMKSTGSKTRSRIAKTVGIGAVAPSGDSLGSLDPRIPLPKLEAKKEQEPADQESGSVLDRDPPSPPPERSPVDEEPVATKPRRRLSDPAKEN